MKIEIEENLHNKQTWDECEMKKKRCFGYFNLDYIRAEMSEQTH